MKTPEFPSLRLLAHRTRESPRSRLWVSGRFLAGLRKVKARSSASAAFITSNFMISGSRYVKSRA
jgi:hypothetical protein